jgi:ABC-type phosphate/phosphonate transport system ATPase subunit
MQAVEVQELRTTYPGGVEAVNRIDFDVEAGEAFGLLGPNAAGKSTTVGMLTTTIAPTADRARLAGDDVSCWRVYARVTRWTKAHRDAMRLCATASGLVSRAARAALAAPPSRNHAGLPGTRCACVISNPGRDRIRRAPTGGRITEV